MSEEGRDLPGPPKAYYFGNLLQFGSKGHMTFTKWAKEYGPIFGVHLGPMGPCIVLNNHDGIKKAFEGNPDVFSGRFVLPIVKISGDYGSLTWENGEDWEKRRQLLCNVIDKLDLDKLAHDEATGFCDMLSKSQNKPPETVYQLIYEAVLNMSAAFCFRRGKPFEYDDPKFRKWVDCFTANRESRHNIMGEPGNIFPILWSTFLYNKFRRIGNTLSAYVEEELDARSSHPAQGSVQDLMDGYLAKVGGIEFPPKDSIPTIVTVTSAIMTLKNAMWWLILLISKHNGVQTKIQNEITSVLGDKAPTMDDAINLPYTNAAIYETLRYGCATAIIVPHMVQKDSTFEGYDIKKGTVVFGNIWGIHYDSKYWENPEKFNPDRFLNSEGKLDANKDSFVPFSLGRRGCPGKIFAMKAMFLFVANVYQRYGFEAIKGEPLPDATDGIVFCGVHEPPPYKLKIVPR